MPPLLYLDLERDLRRSRGVHRVLEARDPIGRGGLLVGNGRKRVPALRADRDQRQQKKTCQGVETIRDRLMRELHDTRSGGPANVACQ